MIVNGENIKKKFGFGNFHFPAAESGKLHKQVLPQLLGHPRLKTQLG